MHQSQFIPPPPFLLGAHMFVLSACLLSYFWGRTICSLAKTSSSICIHQIIPPLTTEGYHSSSSLPCLRHHQYFFVTGLFPLGHMVIIPSLKNNPLLTLLPSTASTLFLCFLSCWKPSEGCSYMLSPVPFLLFLITLSTEALIPVYSSSATLSSIINVFHAAKSKVTSQPSFPLPTSRSGQMDPSSSVEYLLTLDFGMSYMLTF